MNTSSNTASDAGSAPIQSRREFLNVLAGKAALLGAAAAFGPVTALTQDSSNPPGNPSAPAKRVSRPEFLAKYNWTPDAINRPVGVARGIHPGRVVWTHDPAATQWSGDSSDLQNAWWTDRATDQSRVDRMVALALTRLTSAENERQAWMALFQHFHSQKSGQSRGYQRGEVIAIKINLNGANTGDEKRNLLTDATPHPVLAITRQLVENAGVLPQDILIYEAAPHRYLQTYILKKIWAAYPRVRFLQQPSPTPRQSAAGNIVAAEYVEAVTFSHPIKITHAGKVPRLVAEATYLINLPILKGHSNPYNPGEAGDQGQTAVTLSGKNHFGSILGPGELHNCINTLVTRKASTYSPIVDLAAAPRLGGKTLLFLMDGLYCGRRHLSLPQHFPNAPFHNRMEPYTNPEWPASILASQDGVALDSVALDILYAQTRGNVGPDGRPRMAIREYASDYLKEMACPNPAPSGTVYQVEGKPIESLGVHESWNNAQDRQYSRNLDPVKGRGIELLYEKIS